MALGSLIGMFQVAVPTRPSLLQELVKPGSGSFPRAPRAALRNLQGGAGLLARDGAVRQALAPSDSDGLLAWASLWKALLRAPMESPTMLNLVSLLINTESSM